MKMISKNKFMVGIVVVIFFGSMVSAFSIKNKDVSTCSDGICGNDTLGNGNSSMVNFSIDETTTAAG